MATGPTPHPLAAKETRPFLEEEFRNNKSHADHINDHRLDFLKFFAGIVISTVGLTQFLLGQAQPSPQGQQLLEPLLLAALVFGLGSILILCNYWIARDFMRLKNQVITEELLKPSPSLRRYSWLDKKHVSKLPSPRSMFAFVLGLVILANNILVYLLAVIRGGVAFWWLVGATAAQLAVAGMYRLVIHGRPKPLPQ